MTAALGSCIHAELGGAIHRSAPGIKATILIAVGTVSVAPASEVGSVTTIAVLHTFVGVVQILRHPGLTIFIVAVTDFSGLVNLAV